MRLKWVDYDAMRKAFDEKFKETMKLIEEGETHLDNLAEGFHEADGVIWRMPTIDAVPVVRCGECKYRSGLIGRPPFMFYICTCAEGLTGAVRENSFCSYGERKDGE